MFSCFFSCCLSSFSSFLWIYLIHFPIPYLITTSPPNHTLHSPSPSIAHDFLPLPPFTITIKKTFLIIYHYPIYPYHGNHLFFLHHHHHPNHLLLHQLYSIGPIQLLLHHLHHHHHTGTDPPRQLTGCGWFVTWTEGRKEGRMVGKEWKGWEEWGRVTMEERDGRWEDGRRES